MTTDICECQEAPKFESATCGGPVCSRCGKKMILSRQIGEIRKVIDQFELWKCGDDADGYNVSADHLAVIIAKQSAGDEQAGEVRGPCIPVNYCGLATSTHVPVGSDEDHCDLCGHPAQPLAASLAAALVHPAAWTPPPAAVRPDGYQCLIWHRGRWRHVSWTAAHRGWMFGYASAQAMDTPDRLYAPLPTGTPESDFWQGEKS